MQLNYIKGEMIRYHIPYFQLQKMGMKTGGTTLGGVTIITPDTLRVITKSYAGNLQESVLAAGILISGLAAVFVQNANQLNFLFAYMLPVSTGLNAD